MMLYLTGASSSLKKSEYAPQEDVSKSLGGYISSSSVPNGSVNGLFDMISLLTLKNKQKETIGIALVNKLANTVYDIELKMVSEFDSVCKFKIAAVTPDESLCMEHISNKQQEPIQADFYDATFYRASVEVKVLKSAISGETIIFEPFGVSVEVTDGNISGTINAIVDAFSNNETYVAKKLSEDTFRIERRDDTTLDTPLQCSYTTSDVAEFSFSDNFKNTKDGTVHLVDELASGAAIGIWLQRDFNNKLSKTNEEIINDYENKIIDSTLESAELVISYNISNE